MTTVVATTPPCPGCGEQGSLEVEEFPYLMFLLGTKVQEAFPGMAPAEREQLLSGFHPACWDIEFSDDSEEAAR